MPARFIFVVALLVAACQLKPTSALNETKSLFSNLEYKVVYRNGDFEVREAVLGEKNLSKFVSLSTRVENTVVNYDPSLIANGMDWCNTLKQTGWCSQTITIDNNNHFVFQCDSGTFERNCKLYRNNQYLWDGYMNGGQVFPIESIKKVKDELTISYIDANVNNGLVRQFIVSTKGSTFVQIENAYSPNEILGELLYFHHDSKEVMVFNGQDISETFDAILHWPCCGGGYNMNINSNGRVVDFFAQKGNNWYHVQAGDTSYLESLTSEGK